MTNLTKIGVGLITIPIISALGVVVAILIDSMRWAIKTKHYGTLCVIILLSMFCIGVALLIISGELK